MTEAKTRAKTVGKCASCGRIGYLAADGYCAFTDAWYCAGVMRVAQPLTVPQGVPLTGQQLTDAMELGG